MHLIDTSAWIDYFKTTGDPGVRERVGALLKQSDASWCELVFLELQGSPNSRQSAAISALEPVLPLYPINQSCWTYAYEIARMSRKLGKPVPNTDILIYATATIYHVKVLHNDKHFDRLDKITGQNIAER